MLTTLFPNLLLDGYEVTSEASTNYNCIAWAGDDNSKRWDPDPIYKSAYWPAGVPREQTINAFVEVFTRLGYKETNVETLEAGYEKVAIYARLNIPQHVARQLDNGKWTSKIGDLEDITHTMNGLQSADYGSMIKILKRKKV